MDKREVLWLVSIAILSIIITTIIILCVVLQLLGKVFIPVITIAFLAFAWWASNHG